MNRIENGVSVVDVIISNKDGIIFIEAKYLAPVNLSQPSPKPPLSDLVAVP
jgi:hypothetical protein